jgi:hypothetical protein
MTGDHRGRSAARATLLVRAVDAILGTYNRAGRVEHLVTFQPMVGMVDSEHFVFAGYDPVKVTEPVEATEVERMEWVPLAEVPALIESGDIWNSGSLVGLLKLLAKAG